MSRGWLVRTIVRDFGILLACYFVVQQHNKWRYVSDQSQASHFRNYASAVLDPLPANAILLINYDQQWTSVRYMQRCEGHRTDVTAINLSLMTYRWFQHKHDLYPGIIFPGTFHAAPNSASMQNEKAFTLHQFVQANTKKKKKVFLGGKLNFPDPEMDQNFENVPVGLVTQLVPMHKSPNGTKYLKSTLKSLSVALEVLSGLPNATKYPETTWEWTIGRDFKDRITDTAAFALQTAIKVAAVDPQPLIYSLYLLETAVMLEENNVPTTLIKNTGLAHVHAVQNKLIATGPEEVQKGLVEFKLPGPDFFHSLEPMGWPEGEGKDWKQWSSDRFMRYWGEFVQRPDAKEDPQFAMIKGLYEKAVSLVKQAAGEETQPGQTSDRNTPEQEKKEKKAIKKKRKKESTNRA